MNGLIPLTNLLMMKKKQQIPNSSSSSASTSSSQVPFILTPTDSLSALESLTVELYNALNENSSAKKLNTDLRDQLKECH